MLASVTEHLPNPNVDDPPKPNPAEAGAAAPMGGRILGGSKVASRTEAPWIVRFIDCDAYCRHVCAGALITPSHVLTAAQCFYKSDNPTEPRTSFSAILGDLLIVTAEFTEQERRVNATTPHPEFDNTADVKVNDIGIVTLNGPPLKMGPNVGVIGIASTAVPKVGSTVTIYGWGLSSKFNVKGAKSPYLNSADLTVYDFVDCSTSFWNSSLKADQQVCLFDENRSACTSDWGGPAVVKSPTDGSVSLLGVISSFDLNPDGWRIFNRCRLGSKPNVITIVLAYSDWINEVTAG